MQYHVSKYRSTKEAREDKIASISTNVKASYLMVEELWFASINHLARR